MAWVRDVGSLYDFIGYVVLRAPDRFPREDYLQDEDQMTLDKAFDELRQGLTFVEADFPDRQIRATLLPVLDEAHASYRAGDEAKGASRLNDFSAMIFKE